MAIFTDSRKELRRLTKELLATKPAIRITESQLKKWTRLMNSTDGELLKEVLVLKECLANPKVGLKLLKAIPKWIADQNRDYLADFPAPLRQAQIGIDYPPKKVGKPRK